MPCLSLPDRIRDALRRWLEPLGRDLPSVHLVGGAVRDGLLGRAVKDIDLMTGAPEVLARRLAEVHGASVAPFLNKADAPCYRVASRENPNDFLDLVPVRGGGVEADLGLRDFTVNAMAVRIAPGGEPAETLDPYGGRGDLTARRIRTVSAGAFPDDPLRILRAPRLAAQLGFVIDPETVAQMGPAARGLVRVAAERISAELLAILDTPAAAEPIRLLDRVGALSVILPEVEPMRGCTQNEFHHLDVWGHTLAALAAAEAILADLTGHFGGAAGRVAEVLAEKRRTALLKLAILMHDSGKPAHRAADPETGRVIFHGHDRTGAGITEAAVRRLRLSRRAVAFVTTLVAHHMHLRDLSAPGVRPATVARWCRRLGDSVVPAILLTMADIEAARGPAADPARRQRHRDWATGTIRTYFDTIKPRLAARPLVTGRDLMALGMAPGPMMGQILDRVRAAQDAGAVTTRAAALTLAARHLKGRPEMDEPQTCADDRRRK